VKIANPSPWFQKTRQPDQASARCGLILPRAAI